MPPPENSPAPADSPEIGSAGRPSGSCCAIDCYPMLREALFALDAETAHHLTLRGLAAAHALHLDSLPGLRPPSVELAPVKAMGLVFPNPVGLAAGLDKDGIAVDALGALGFGFLEIGTLTPRPQPGNPLPRLFRLPSREAIVNRMGFNNLGIDAAVARLRHRRYRGVLGVNIGKNFDTPNEQAVDDYLHCLQRAYAVADYVAVNLSSPNTSGLRDLQEASAFRALLGRLKQEQADLTAKPGGKYTPIVVKIAPDLDDAQVEVLADVIMEVGIDGVIATNTTVDRSAVGGLPHASERGGLSGAPLTERALALTRVLAARLNGRVPIIGVGGIMTARDALDRLDAGARLIQIYSGLVYHGPPLVHEILAAIAVRRNKQPVRAH